MKGKNISQGRATRLAIKGKKVLLCPETGFWLKTNKLVTYDADEYTTGDKLETIPATAFEWVPGHDPDKLEA